MAFVILCFLSSTVPAVMLAKAAEVVALVTRKINGFFVFAPRLRGHCATQGTPASSQFDFEKDRCLLLQLINLDFHA